MLARLQSENESTTTTVHVLIQNVTEEQIDKVRSQLPFRRMTRVWMEADNAIIKIMTSSKHEVACVIFSDYIKTAIMMVPGQEQESFIGLGQTVTRPSPLPITKRCV